MQYTDAVLSVTPPGLLFILSYSGGCARKAGLPPASVLSPTSWAQNSSGFQPDKVQFIGLFAHKRANRNWLQSSHRNYRRNGGRVSNRQPEAAEFKLCCRLKGGQQFRQPVRLISTARQGRFRSARAEFRLRSPDRTNRPIPICPSPPIRITHQSLIASSIKSPGHLFFRGVFAAQAIKMPAASVYLSEKPAFCCFFVADSAPGCI